MFDPSIATPALRQPGLAEVATLHRHNVSVQPPRFPLKSLTGVRKSG